MTNELKKQKTTVTMSCELWGQINSLINALNLNLDENVIQRQLGMVWYLFDEEFCNNDR